MLRIFSQYVSRRAYLYFLADALLVSGSIAAGVALRFWHSPELIAYYTELPDFAYRVATVTFFFLLFGYYNGLYSNECVAVSRDHFFRLAQALGAGCFALAAIYFAVPSLRIGRGAFAIGVVLALVMVAVYRQVADFLWTRAVPRTRVLLLGSRRLAAETAKELEFRHDLNLQVIGFVRSDDADETAESIFEEQVIGRASDIEALTTTYRAERIIVALEDDEPLPVRLLLGLRTRGVQIEDAHSTLVALTGRIPLDSVKSSWFIFSEGFRRSATTLAVKRSVDLTLSLVGLALSLPLMALTALAVKLDSPGPILFRQRRVGLNGVTFELMKFRTMQQNAEADGVARWATEGDPRITRWGGFLRKYRLDELPQFVNVIRGEMSFVGPRPERPEFVEQLRTEIPYYDERHTVRPGITGWAQVCYPYGASVEDALRKLEYDLFYLKNVSILFDLAIVFQTIKIILWGQGR